MIHETLRFSRVTYRENENLYLRDFDLDIRQGEILGLLPLNHYGLPALLKVMQFNPPLYYGNVYYQGRLVNSWRDMNRKPNLITLVDTVSSLVAGQTVVANIFLLTRQSSFLVKQKELEEKLKPFLEEIGMDISPRARAEDLTAFERVVVEILKGVIWGHKLIVLREASANIGENNLERLCEIMECYRKKGISFLFISSHYEELSAFCDRAVLMSNGRILKKFDMRTERELFTKVCADIFEGTENYRKKAGDHAGELPVMEIRNLEGTYLEKTNVRIYKGEYLAWHIPDIRNYRELTEIIFGEDRPSHGYVLIEGELTDPLKTRDIAFLKANADTSMIFPEMSYMDNLLFTCDHRASSVWRSRGVKKSILQEFSGQLGDEVFSKPVDTLSKRERLQLLYARVTLQHPKVVFCEMPFRDADQDIKLLVRELQRNLNQNGIAVVVMTMNLNEKILQPDRVIQIKEKL